MLLAHIPKGILDKIRRPSFDFLWKGNRDKMGYHLAQRQIISRPKDQGG
jgi:hypothetical protein